MLDTVWVVQVLGMGVSLPLIIGLVGCCIRISKSLWPFLFLAFLFLSSSLLTWQAPFEARWLAHVLAGFLLLTTATGVTHLATALRKNPSKPSDSLPPPHGRVVKLALGVLSVALFIEVLFAAFPG